VKELHDLHRFTGCMWFLVVDSCLEQQYEPIEACLNKFWVDLDELGLGFASEKKRERREEREEREMKEENELNRAKTFYISALDRVGSDPIQHPVFPAIRSRFSGYPDQSNASEAFWRSGSTKLHGFGLHNRGLWVSFFFFLEFVAMHTSILVIWTPVRSNFLAKIPKKLLCVSWCIFDCFVIFFTCLKLIKIYANFFYGVVSFVYF